jgi:hypothetical protein
VHHLLNQLVAEQEKDHLLLDLTEDLAEVLENILILEALVIHLPQLPLKVTMEDQEEPHLVVELEVAEAVAQTLQDLHKHQPLVDLEEMDQVVGLEIVQQELEVAEEL